MNRNEFDSNKFNSNRAGNDPYNENNFSSNNSRMFKNSEFNSVQNDFNYNIQMGFTSKVSTLIKNVKSPENTKQSNFLLSRSQEFDKFEDEAFKPDFPYKLAPKQKLSWDSPKDLFSEELVLFPKDSNGVFLPSEFKNHVFVSCMNLLLNNPALLSRLFEIEQVNSPGIYGVWLCENGVWRIIIVDDRVPCVNGGYAFNEYSGKEKCVYHMLVQKALAKMHKGYEVLAKVPLGEMLNNLTGSQVEVKALLDVQSSDDLWGLIKKWREENYLVFLQNKNEGEADKNDQEDGLAYSVVDCTELISNQDELERVLRIKSPVKGKVMEGKYFKGVNLTAEEKKRLKIGTSSNEEAFFCLTLGECFKFFSEIGVCKARNNINAMYTWQEVKNQEYFLARFRLDAPGHVSLSLNQKDGTHHIRGMLAKEDFGGKIEEKLRLITAEYSNKKVFLEKNDLETGNYVLVVEVLWADGVEKEVTIGCLCENESANQNLEFEIQAKKNSELLEIQKNLLKDYAKSKDSNTMRIRDYSSSGEPSITIYNDMVFGLSYFYYINQSNKKLKEAIAMQTLKNLRICEPFKDNMAFEIELDPKEEIIVLYKYEKNGKDFSYALTIKASLERANSVISSSQINYENSEIKNSEIKMNASKMKSSSVVFNEQNPKDELFKCIKQKGAMRKRFWKNKEIDVEVYTCVHKEGVAMLYLNNSQRNFEETIHLTEMNNLVCSNLELKGGQQKIEVYLEAGKSEMILFHRQVSNEDFTYRFKHTYKLF